MGFSTKEEALHVLDESKRYGLAMFPEQAQTKEVADVGEDLARERARAQRKLLEERGEADADVKREVQREQRQAKKAKEIEKERANVIGKRRALLDREDEDSDEMIVEYQGYAADTLNWDTALVATKDSTPPQHKPKPRPRRIAKRPITSEESSSAADLINDASVNRTARKPKQITGKVNHNEGDERMKIVLGKTKRRRKAKTT